MSRTRNAGIIAAFGYIQFALAFVSGIVLLPLILRKVGAETYGWWLACGELLAYSAMVDLGALGVLPWAIAQRDGERNREMMRGLVANGMILAAVTGIIYSLVALALWHFATKVTGLNPTQKEFLFTPLLIVIAGTTLTFPLRTFAALLQGLQDVVFLGIAGVIQWSLNVGLALVLLFKGYGLYALAFSVAIPPLLYSLMCLVRAMLIAPDLVRGLRKPDFKQMYQLTRDGLGVWLGSLGWRMAAASNSLVIVSMMSPQSAVVFACTAKMGDILTQMAWQLADSGLIGLAQLSGEAGRERVRAVVLSMLRLLLIAVGGVAYLVLIINPTFVRLWVGADKFGGYTLNTLLTLNVISISLAHGLFVTASVLGMRFETGMATFLQGCSTVAAAVLLGYIFGLPGVALAGLISTTLVAIPLGWRYLRKVSGMTAVELWREALAPWGIRMAALAVAGALAGLWVSVNALWLLIVLAPFFCLIYVWYMRPLYTGLPLPLKLQPLLMKIRLIPQQ